MTAMRGWPSGASRVLRNRKSNLLGERVLGGYWEVPTQYGQRGVDVAIEVSGSTRPCTTPFVPRASAGRCA